VNQEVPNGGLCSQRGKEGGRMRGVLEKRIEGSREWFLRKNEVLLKVKKKGKNCF